MKAHVAEDCKNDYAAQLQKYNKEQNQFYFSDMPLIFNVSSLHISNHIRLEKLAIILKNLSKMSSIQCMAKFRF